MSQLQPCKQWRTDLDAQASTHKPRVADGSGQMAKHLLPEARHSKHVQETDR